MSRVGRLAVRRNHGPTNCLAASAAAPKLGVSGSPSNNATICIATSGWRTCTLGKQFAQLLQWAGTLVHTTLRSSHPPIDNSNDSDAFTPASHLFLSTSRIKAKHSQYVGHCCEQNVLLNQGSQPAEENWHVQPHND